MSAATLSESDARTFLGVAAQVLPFLYIAARLEVRAIPRTARQSEYDVPLVLTAVGLFCLLGEFVAVVALVSGSVDRWAVATVAAAMVSATILLLMALATQETTTLVSA